MPQDDNTSFKIQPMIACPVRAQIGKKYLLSVDVECPDFPNWPYESEEHVLYCLVESRPLFTCQPVGDAALVVHRFGGTYGPAQFLLTAAGRELTGSVRITLVNGRGVPIRTVEIRNVRVTREETAGETVPIPLEPPAPTRRSSRQRPALKLRVHIVYDIEFSGTEQHVELPFVMGVMSDLSGRPAEPLPEVADRKFHEIDIDNFDEHLKACKPRVAFQVPNTITGEGNLAVEMTFEKMEDFSPAAVARKVEPLSRLLRARAELASLLKYIDGKGKAEALIGRILNEQDLMKSIASIPIPGGQKP